MGCSPNKQNQLATKTDNKNGDKKGEESKKGDGKTQKVEADDKKNKYDEVFEEIMDIKDLQIKGDMLLSENMGKPKETYETLENIAQSNNILIKANCGLIKKVKHKVTSRIRAMKIIKKELLEMKEEEAGLFKEIALLRSLDHPNILKLYEFYRDERCYYLLCEYCEHGELYDIIKDHKRSGLDEISTAYIMRQLLSVVFYCHSNSIINRDFRPENILIESEEKLIHENKEITLYNIRVSDFKSARTFKTSKKLNKKVGNPYYIAPEVLKRKYNEKCDIWSCGIIMYVLLTGKPPFSGSTDKEVLEKVEQNLFEYFDKDLAKVSQECKNLIKDLTKYDPSKRPSAGEALKNKWFKTVLDFKNKFVNTDTILDAYKNLMNFSPDFKFQQACFAYMIHHLTDQDEIKDLRKIFELFDVNNDGKLSHQELIDGFKCVYTGKAEKEIQKVLKRIDQDRSGFIEFEEFIRATINKKNFISEEKIKTAFDLIKDTKSGTITVSELKVILGLASKQFSDKVWNEIISQIFHQVDENNDNEINYDEFKNMMIKLVI